MIKLSIEGKVPVVFFKDDGVIVAYSPALDLSSCGETIKEAQKHFESCLKIYLEETIKHGTLEKDLLNLGWKSNPKKYAFIPSKERIKSIPSNIIRKTEIKVPISV